MNILLINVDSRFNLAIRRMYNFFNNKGYRVVMKDLGYTGYQSKRHDKITIDAKEYDKVYVSNIFDINAYVVDVINCKDVIYGGIGSRNPDLKLPEDIEHTDPYYYPDEDTSYGFITRGCIRKCWFCKVPKHEGCLKFYNSVDSIIKHKKVKFLDNNILAYDKHMDVFKYLIERNIRCEFNQGLDFRLANDENLEALSKLNYMGEYIFAFDDPKYQPLLDEKIILIKKYIPKPWKVKFYIYCNADMDLHGMITRTEWCREHEVLPYIMRDINCYSSEYKYFFTDWASYCNQPGFFKKMGFLDFLSIRHKNKGRIEYSSRMYRDTMGGKL